MLTFIFLLCLGHLLAVGVHSGTWWLRKRALGETAALGALCCAVISLFVLFVLSVNLYDEDGNWPAEVAAAHQQEFTIALCWFGAFCLATVWLGLYHSYLLEKRWQWKLWAGTFLALWFELALAWWLSGRLADFSEQLLGPTSSASWLRGHNPWSFGPYALTLITLALFHPLALRIVRGLPDSAQIWRAFRNRLG